MIEYLQQILYPLGFIAPLAFGSRVLLQWLTSEVKKESVVPALFWKLSIIGNVSLWLHASFQSQIHVALIQACNGVISWRNLNLMQDPTQQSTLRKTIFYLLAATGGTVLLFFLQGYLNHNDVWFRIPQAPWQTHAEKKISLIWHLIGTSGLILFNSRFWLQWISVEKYKKSYLGTSFWWISLIGDSLCLAYFLRIHDPVNFIGPILGLVPYIRNLILIHKSSKKSILEKSS